MNEVSSLDHSRQLNTQRNFIASNINFFYGYSGLAELHVRNDL